MEILVNPLIVSCCEAEKQRLSIVEAQEKNFKQNLENGGIVLETIIVDGKEAQIYKTTDKYVGLTYKIEDGIA